MTDITYTKGHLTGRMVESYGRNAWLKITDTRTGRTYNRTVSLSGWSRNV